MDPTYAALIGAAIGGLFTALGPVITGWIQSRAQDRRERLRQVSDLALEEQKLWVEISKDRPGKKTFLPLIASLDFYMRAFVELEKGPLTPAKLESIRKDNEQLFPKMEP